MNPSPSRQEAALKSALQRVKSSFKSAVDELLDSAAQQAPALAAREDWQVALHELGRKHSVLVMAFDESVEASVTNELRRRQQPGDRAPNSSITNWQALTLVDDQEVEREVIADRLGQALRASCEAEVREFEQFLQTVLPESDRPDGDRNPLRPDTFTRAILSGVHAIVPQPSAALALSRELIRIFGKLLPTVYREITADWTALGYQAASMSVRTARNSTEFSSFSDSGSRAADMAGDPTTTRPGGGTSSGTGAGTPGGGAGRGGGGAPGPEIGAAGGTGTPIGHVDHEVMALIKRLALAGAAQAVDSELSAWEARVSVSGAPESLSGAPLPNLIAAHREELRSATTSSLDHMVIDVVGGLFDQILSDPKVPPQMARHIARLQLPVLRAALGDKTFFSKRKHPVRRFVNRIATLAVAYDDFSEGRAAEFLRLVRELVDEIVEGDFDQIEPYEEKLDRLETFVAEGAKADVEEKHHDAGSMLNQRELEMLQHQRYTQQMHAALLPVQMDDFLRSFITQVWSQAIAQSHRAHGDDSPTTRRMRAVGRDLIISVQPKSTPQERKNFLVQLPQLMKDVTAGLAMIGWPEEAKKDFLGKLLPAHSESLKATRAVSQLEHNLLVKQLDAIMATPLPKPGEMPLPGAPMPSLEDVIAPVFSEDELRRVGLVREAQVDWDGSVDIDITAEPEVAVSEMAIAGLPAPTEPNEPTQGAVLADHVQIGISYRMFYQKAWHKVRLSHVSPGRSFFVFTHGRDHSEAISMTARMLLRLCESGRLRAFENAYLIERATARARKQLAGLNTRPSALA